MNNELIQELINNPLEARELLRASFKNFIKVFYFYLKNENFIFKDFHNILINKLENIVFNTSEAKNLAISISPRTGKSAIIKYFIAWSYAVNKDCNFIYTSYSDRLITGFSGEVKDLIESELYRNLFTIKLKQNTQSKTDWKIENGGQLRACGVGGAITGFGYSSQQAQYSGCCIVDDLLKADNYKSEIERQNCIDFYINTLKTRNNNSIYGKMIVVMQRLHKDDLIGFLQENEKDLWDFVSIPAINEKGESIFPERLSLDFLNEMKKLSVYTFQAQYMQEPISMGGNVIKSEWYKSYTELPVRFDYLFMVCDTAFSVKQTADNSAFMVCGLYNEKIYVIDLYANKVDFPQLRRDVLAMYNKYNSIYNNFATIYIENKVSGQSLIQELQAFGLPISELYPTYYNKELKKELTTDKLTRYMEVASDLQNGYVYIPENVPWIYDFLKESEQFDGLGKSRDDRIDTLIYSLKVRRQNMLTSFSKAKSVFSR